MQTLRGMYAYTSFKHVFTNRTHLFPVITMPFSKHIDWLHVLKMQSRILVWKCRSIITKYCQVLSTDDAMGRSRALRPSPFVATPGLCGSGVLDGQVGDSLVTWCSRAWSAMAPTKHEPATNTTTASQLKQRYSLPGGLVNPVLVKKVSTCAKARLINV